MQPTQLTILGGGIAGLSAAYYAAKNHPDWQVTLLEAGDRWGGKIATERVPFDGGHFVIEGGPDTFLATKPWGVGLCRELGLSERLHGTNPRPRKGKSRLAPTYVLHRGRLEPLPEGLAMMLPGKVAPMLRTRLLTWPQKARMGLDFVLPPRRDDADETLGGFISRRLGRGAYENLVEPLMSGIYAGDGDKLSLLSTFPYLRDLERKYGSIARGAMTMYRQRVAANQVAANHDLVAANHDLQQQRRLPGSRSAFLTPTTGLAEIVEALVTRLEAHGVDLRLNAPARQVSRTAQGWQVTLTNGETLSADALILATPAWVSAELLRDAHADLAAALGRIPYVSTATVTLAYRLSDVPRPLDGYGYVIPRREGRQALACTWTSTKFPHRAPEGYALLRVFIGRAGEEFPLPPTQPSPLRGEGFPFPFPSPLGGGDRGGGNLLLQIAREELRLTLGITAEPLVERVFIWEKAMPQYNLGHQDILQQIDAALTRLPGLALAGNGYRGIGIPDCIHSGEVAVNQLT